MKFTQYLLTALIQEWVKLYLNFKLLKTYLSIATILKQFLLDAKQSKYVAEYKQIKNAIMQDQDLIAKIKADDKEFNELLKSEVAKVVAFVIFKYKDLQGKAEKLEAQITAMKEEFASLLKWTQTIPLDQESNHFTHKQRAMAKKNKERLNDHERKKEILHNSFFQFYVEIQYLEDFIIVNSEAARKIIKKYKKQEIRGLAQSEAQFTEITDLQKKIKQMPKLLGQMKDKTEHSMIKNFYLHKNPRECRLNLRRYTQSNEMKVINVFFFGLFVGFAFVFIGMLIFMRYDGYLDPNSNKVFNKVFPCFRGLALFLVYYWMITLDVVGWNYFKINYKLYLGFNYHFSTLPEILQRLSLFSALYLILFVLYCIQEEDLGQLGQDIELFRPRNLPLILWLILFLYVFYPFRRFNYQGRQWMYQNLYGMFIGHFYNYESRFTFMADQFCSMTTPIRDLDYTICYYYTLFVTGEEHNGQCDVRLRFTSMLPSTIPYIIKCLHYITRGRQKGRFFWTDEMWNFLKTLNSANVGFWSYMARLNRSYLPIWVFFAIISTFWQYWWDLKKDFLFFEPNSKFKFLRNDLGYNSPKVYYALAVINFILRLTWCLSLSPEICRIFGIKNELFVLIVGCLEMSRRFLNNFLKMEKEHIVNLRTLKPVQDLKMPFKGGLDFEMQELPDMSARWSVSSFHQSLSGFGSFADEIKFKSNRPSIIFKQQKTNLSFESALQDSLLDVPKLTLNQSKILFDGSPRQTFNQLNRSQIDMSGMNYSPPNGQSVRMVNQTRNESFILDPKILEEAKSKEKLELQRILELKEENKYFKQLIAKAYEKYGVLSN